MGSMKMFIIKEITLNGTGMSSFALGKIVPLKYTFNIYFSAQYDKIRIEPFELPYGHSPSRMWPSVWKYLPYSFTV